MFNREELSILEELINEEIYECLRSGQKLDSEYVIRLRDMLFRLNLKEIYDYSRWEGKE